MEKEEWLQLKKRGPGQFIDFISCYRKGAGRTLKKRSLTDVAQDVVVPLAAMANAGGGTVFLGADAEGEISGTFFRDEGAKKTFIRNLAVHFIPGRTFRSEEEVIDAKILLRFTVDPGVEIHVWKNGKGYLRVGTENIPLSRGRLIALRESREGTWHEREALPGSSPGDLDQDLVADFIRRTGNSGSAEEILFRPYGLFVYRDGKPLLTRAAAYLFARDPLRWHARPGIEFIRLEGTEQGGRGEYNVLERRRLELPLFGILREMDGRIAEWIQERTLVRDLFFREKFEYPARTWKEALLNALTHRDYAAEGSAIQLCMFEDRLEIRSPGRLPGPVALSYLGERKRIHYHRNPLMARALADSGAMPGLGLGVPMIFKTMDDCGLNPPEFREEGDFLVVSLRNTPVFDRETLVWLERFRGQDINSRQKRILVYAKAHGMMFNSSDYQNLGVDRDTAYHEIKDLIRRQIVRPFRRHGKVYRLLDAASRIAELPGLPWVIEIMKAKGFFTAADLKDLRSVSRETTREMIRNLADQDFLTLSGKGRGLRYFPTERLKSFLESPGKDYDPAP